MIIKDTNIKKKQKKKKRKQGETRKDWTRYKYSKQILQSTSTSLRWKKNTGGEERQNIKKKKKNKKKKKKKKKKKNLEKQNSTRIQRDRK